MTKIIYSETRDKMENFDIKYMIFLEELDLLLRLGQNHEID